MSNASLELGGDNWAAKDGNLLGYAVGDSSGKYVPREFTFTRGSNLAATRVAANGLIEKGRENLLLQSNQFDTTWTASGSTGIISSGFTGYDGTNDAWQLEHKGSQYTSIRQSISTSGVQTFSCYAKAGTLDYILLYTGNPRAWFDLVNGVVGSTSSTIGASITSVGEGWYRCSITFEGSVTSARIYPNDASGTFGTTAGTIYIQDAQLEQGLVATDYIETGATTVQAGLLEDEPRIDYTGGTGSLLLEPSRTQLIGQSEYISQSELSPYGTDVTHNATQSPSGKNSAALVYEESSNSQHYVLKGVTTSSSTTYTQSAFVKKKDSGIYASLRTNGVGGNSYIIFDFDTATIVDEGSDIISSGVVDYSNGWYRIHMTYTLATISFIAGITNSTTNPIPSYLGTGKGYYLWGAQLEEGSYPTSYIPNHSGGSVTRGVEEFEATSVSSLINSQEGVYFLETQALADSENYRCISLSDGTFNNVAQIRYGNGSDVIQVQYRTGASNQALITTTSYDITNSVKIALKYEENSFKMFINGQLLFTDTSGAVSSANTLDTIRSNRGDAGDRYEGRVKQLLLFPTALSDADCITLTTL